MWKAKVYWHYLKGMNLKKCQNMKKAFNNVLKHWNKILGVLSTFVTSIRNIIHFECIVFNFVGLEVMSIPVIVFFF